MNKELKLLLILIFGNIAILACFTILAVIFNKWWIVFFSMLFLRPFNFDIKTEIGDDDE